MVVVQGCIPFNSIEWIRPQAHVRAATDELLSIPLNGFVKLRGLDLVVVGSRLPFNSIEWILST